jgi:nucleotide-binding universal stress UspA family protein
MIVVLADGSQAGLQAVEWAAHEAAQGAVGLHVLHAVSAAWKPAAQGDGSAGAVEVVGDDAGAVLDRARVRALTCEPRVPVTTAVVRGDPRPALVEAAREAELLVLGDRGLVDHGLGAFSEPPVNSAGLGVSTYVLCDAVVVRRPTGALRLSPAQWLFDPTGARLGEIDPCGLFKAAEALELGLTSSFLLPSERA